MIVNLPSTVYISKPLDFAKLDEPALRTEKDDFDIPESIETMIFTRLSYRRPARMDPLGHLDEDILRGWKYRSEKSGWGEVLGEGDGRIGAFRDVVEDR